MGRVSLDPTGPRRPVSGSSRRRRRPPPPNRSRARASRHPAVRGQRRQDPGLVFQEAPRHPGARDLGEGQGLTSPVEDGCRHVASYVRALGAGGKASRMVWPGNRPCTTPSIGGSPVARSRCDRGTRRGVPPARPPGHRGRPVARASAVANTGRTPPRRPPVHRVG